STCGKSNLQAADFEFLRPRRPATLARRPDVRQRRVGYFAGSRSGSRPGYDAPLDGAILGSSSESGYSTDFTASPPRTRYQTSRGRGRNGSATAAHRAALGRCKRKECLLFDTSNAKQPEGGRTKRTVVSGTGPAHRRIRVAACVLEV